MFLTGTYLFILPQYHHPSWLPPPYALSSTSCPAPHSRFPIPSFNQPTALIFGLTLSFTTPRLMFSLFNLLLSASLLRLAFAASADQWRGRSIYQSESLQPCILLYPHPLPLTGSSLTVTHCLPGQTLPSVTPEHKLGAAALGTPFAKILITSKMRDSQLVSTSTQTILLIRVGILLVVRVTVQFGSVPSPKITKAHVVLMATHTTVTGSQTLHSSTRDLALLTTLRHYLTKFTNVACMFSHNPLLFAVSRRSHRYLMVDVVVNNVMATSLTPDWSKYMFKDQVCYFIPLN